MNEPLQLLRRDRFHLMIYFAALVLLGVALFSIQSVRLALILSLIFCYLLSPWVNHLERMAVPRSLAILILYLSLSVVLGGAFWGLSPWLVSGYKSLVSDFPRIMVKIQETGDAFLQRFGDHLPESLRENTLQQLVPFIQDSLMNLLAALPSWVPHLTTTLLLVPVFGFFLIRDSSVIKKRLLAPMPNRYFELSLKLSHIVNKKVGDYVRGRLLEASIVGVLVWLGLLIIGFNYSFFFASVAAALNLIPFIGPLVAAIPPLVVALVDFQGWWQVLAVAAIYGGAQIIDAGFVVPVVLSKIIDLHPVWVLVAIFAGGQFYGIVGMVIGVPIVAVFKIVMEEMLARRRPVV